MIATKTQIIKELIKLTKEAFFENWSEDSGQDGICGPAGPGGIEKMMKYDWDRSASKTKLQKIIKLNK